MNLQDAFQLCGWFAAKLIIKDPADPLGWSKVEPHGFGTLYMWTMGHTVPMLQCQQMDEMPSEAEQEVCICGKPHGFPAMMKKNGEFDPKILGLWRSLTLDERWEPVNPITILDAMIRDQPPASLC